MKHNIIDSKIRREEERKNIYKNKFETINKGAVRIYINIYIQRERDINIIALNLNGLNAQSKDTNWLNGYKNKPHIYAAYKKFTSGLETHTD